MECTCTTSDMVHMYVQERVVLFANIGTTRRIVRIWSRMSGSRKAMRRSCCFSVSKLSNKVLSGRSLHRV